MEAVYQTPDFALEELGDLSPAEVVELIRDRDWTKDLMRFASLSLLGEEEDVCPPSVSVQITERTAASIVPSGVGGYTVVASIGTGPKWLRGGQTVNIESASLAELETILRDLELGEFAAIKHRYSP